ncbi:hypothetical protein TSAR_004779 [Trichomalopsis sarcophagae]|uniref:Uncharacterized protein n=1 Tax=Trichomalopsis sarcophagae TaxID=543379 RepID=A0A232EPK3_9HYME|nr:hypothetical protein TSAR_004779 [Trichomalopsis sarcophagae]
MLFHRSCSVSSLQEAIRRGEKKYIQACVSLNSLPPEREWKGGYNILNMALSYKEYEIASILLRKVTIVNNETGQPERTPLHYAATDNRTDLIQQLIEKGADVNAIDEQDMSPLHYAVILDNFETVALLMDNGASADNVTDVVFRFTPYQHACRATKFQIVECFLDHGSNVNDVFELPDNLICPKRSTPLHMAISQKNLETINLLLDRDADVNYVNGNKESSLHLACREDSAEVVKMLIEYKAKINVKTKDNITPLHIAVRNGNIEIVEYLLICGAETDCQDNQGKIPLQLAVEQRHVQIVDRLLERDPTADSVNNRKAFKKALLEYGLRSDIYKCFVRRGFVPTPAEISEVAFAAVTKGYFHIVESLLEMKCEDNLLLFTTRNDIGDTLLHSATKTRQHDIVRLLISRKADVHAINNEGNTPIICAIENNDEHIVKTFLTEGVEAVRSFPLLLHTVIQTKRDKSRRLLELILQQSAADVDQRDEELEGSTALHLVCREAMKCDVELADLLLRKGANVNAATNQGTTALHMAASRKDGESMLRTLLRFDPQLDLRDHCGNTPLHLACSNACTKIVGVLLDAGASVNVKDNLGKTPVDVAIAVRQSLPPRQDANDEAADMHEADVKESVKLLQEHVIKLDVAKLRLSQQISWQVMAQYKHYRIMCENELAELKNYEINSYVSLHDVLMGNTKKIVRYTREENAKSSLELMLYTRKYPIYGNMIDNMKKAVMREYVVLKAKEAINSLTGYGLPDACTENIFEYLRVKDMRNLTLASTMHLDSA